MMRSNCLFFALSLFWRRGRQSRHITVDGVRYYILWRSGDRHILIRTSRLGGWVPHVLYGERSNGHLRIIHFVPHDTRPKRIPPPLFAGRTKLGDFPDTVAEL